MSSRTTKPPAPFWSTATPKPRKPAAGTHAAMVASVVAAGVAARPYSTTESHSVGDLVEHECFGVGLVTELPAPGTVSVLFSDKSRLLVCSFR